MSPPAAGKEPSSEASKKVTPETKTETTQKIGKEPETAKNGEVETQRSKETSKNEISKDIIKEVVKEEVEKQMGGKESEDKDKELAKNQESAAPENKDKEETPGQESKKGKGKIKILKTRNIFTFSN